MMPIDQITCGDALVEMKRIPTGSVDMIFTDPPYGHNNNNGDLIENWEEALGKKKTAASAPRPIANDGLEANQLYRNFLIEAKRVLVNGGCCCCCCCGGGGGDLQFARWTQWMDEVLEFKMAVVWDKGKMGMGWHYRRSYEFVLVGVKGKGACNWYDETNRIENVIRPGDYGIKKIIPSVDQHPTEKPVELAGHFIKLHSKEGDLILDPFAGHGSTLLAALKMKRHFIGIELNPDYVAIAERRVAAARQQLTLL